MREAGKRGYNIGPVFVILADIDLNVKRVARGGHDIPESVIRRRHGRAIERLGQAMLLADETIVLDNTGGRPKVLLRMSDRMIREDHLDHDEPVHALLWRIVASAIND